MSLLELPIRPPRPDPPPEVGLEDVRRWARELYGLEAEARPLTGYEDRSFLLGPPERGSWVLKVGNPATEPGTLALQHATLERLAPALGRAVPEVRRSLAGRDVEAVELEGRSLPLRVLSFVPGTLLADASRRTALTWKSLGDLLGRLSRALAGFEPPGARRRLVWNLEDAAWTLARTDLFEGERRRLVHRHQVQFLGSVQRRLDTLPRGLVHGDANDQNLVVEETPDGARVSGIFDFGDVVRCPRVFELAIAGAYAVFGQEDPLEVLVELARAYHERCPLEPVELAALFPAVCMRLVVSLTCSTDGARLDPGNEYLTVDQANAWDALERLAGLEPASVERELRAACGREGEGGPEELVPHADLLAARRRRIGPSLSLSYDRPLHVVRGRGSYLFDQAGRAHLDCVNNVCHVGHCHPRVVEALAAQAARLNTNTRYLHGGLVRYAERLASLLPEPLEVVYLVNSGSEANELALRLARAATGRRDVVAVEHGYHGNTTSLVDVSHYKHAGRGGRGAPDWVHVVPCPDTYRGRYRDDEPDVAGRYADHVRAAIDSARASGRDVAAFLTEPLIGCGGQVVPPEGWLRRAFAHARAAGAICIADEVQVGLGRVGTHWWAFDEQGAVPDVVTLGKPLGNGHPLAAVVTTRAIADAFDDGMEYFSTFGGNPVSCAVGLAVLDVVEEEGLRERASSVGARLLEGFRELSGRHAAIGDVRGRGLYLGLELVRDRETRTPAPELLARVLEEARASGCLLSSDGPHASVLKVKPPMTFSEHDAELLLQVLDRSLRAAEAAATPGAPPSG